MADVVVTCPMRLWDTWIAEGDLPGESWSGMESHFYLGGYPPEIHVGERVYVVAHGKLRGYAPLVGVERTLTGFALVRHGKAVAVTVPLEIKGFRGWRYRFWDRTEEVPFLEWWTP